MTYCAWYTGWRNSNMKKTLEDALKACTGFGADDNHDVYVTVHPEGTLLSCDYNMPNREGLQVWSGTVAEAKRILAVCGRA